MTTQERIDKMLKKSEAILNAGKQTNEEFLRSCSMDELVNEILSLVDGGILDSWHEEHKEIDEWDDKGVVELWLKEKHDGSN